MTIQDEQQERIKLGKIMKRYNRAIADMGNTNNLELISELGPSYFAARARLRELHDIAAMRGINRPRQKPGE